MKFYTYSQNNSGGEFLGDARYIVVEASSANEANKIAKDRTPVYFNGCDSGRDCGCCGDRWSEQYDNTDGTEKPEVYGMVFEGTEDEIADANFESFAKSFGFGYDADIYYYDGTMKPYRFKKAHYEKSEKKKRDAKKFVWGFVFNSGWNNPTDVFKAFESDYNESDYYDKTGNTSIQVKPDTNYFADPEMRKYGSEHVSVNFATKTEAEKANTDLNATILAANEAAMKVIDENEHKLDKTLVRALKSRFSF